jgi:hypothetical protein
MLELKVAARVMPASKQRSIKGITVLTSLSEYSCCVPILDSLFQTEPCGFADDACL